LNARHEHVDTRRPKNGPGSGRTVLVIEDSEVIRRVLRLILEAEGYRVVESPDGLRAPSLARDHRPDVITLDLSLPDVDGREVLRQLLDDDNIGEVPVVIISAFADYLTGSERQRAADVIVKPFDLDDLLQRLERAISRADRGGVRPGQAAGQV
jgi:CheY-like chemotaxis protein